MWNVYLTVMITINCDFYFFKWKNKQFQLWWFIKVGLGRTILYFIDHHRLNNSKLDFFFKWRNIERYFGIFCLFKGFFFQHHIHKKIFNTFSTNICPNFFQLNLIQLLIWIQFRNLNSIQFSINSSFITMLFMPQFHIGMNQCF